MEEDATLGRIGGFRLIRRLATGGTSDVLLARAEGPHGFERTVVLKRLLSEHQNDPDFARMFTREAAAYARLSHPAIVRLFDFFKTRSAGRVGSPPTDELVMVLEYVDGVSLARLMTHAVQSGQKLDDCVAFLIASRVFDALSAAHDAHDPDTGDPTPVIHRDVNPSNVLIPWNGHAKLADFGIAKITGGEEAETSQGLIKGTYGYMAPEQVRGERVTIRTDVYAASLVLWELLARRKAIQADKLPEMEVLRAMAEPNLPKLDVLRPELPEAVREAVARGLEPNPARRAMTAEEMLGVLRAHFDADDARQRLVRALAPLHPVPDARGPRRSLSDTIAEDMRATAEVALASFGDTLPSAPVSPRVSSPANTLPLATERRPPTPRPAPPVPRPAATFGATAVMASPVPAPSPSPAPVRTQTPSGFRPVTAPQGQSGAAALSKATLAGGFAPLQVPRGGLVPPPSPSSEAPTQKTRTVPEDVVLPVQSSGSLPAAHLVTPWPPPPAVVAPAPGVPSAFAPAPFAPAAPVPVLSVRSSAPPAPAPPGPPAFGVSPLPPPPGASPFTIPTGPAAFAPPPPVLPGPAAHKRSYGAVVAVGALAGILVVVAAGAALVHFRSSKSIIDTPAPLTPTPTPTPTPTLTLTLTPALTPTPTPTPTAAASASAVATATATVPTPPNLPTPGPHEGVLLFAKHASGHRIYVDGRVKGDGADPIVAPCGRRKLQIGSSGKPREMTIPCAAVIRIP